MKKFIKGFLAIAAIITVILVIIGVLGAAGISGTYLDDPGEISDKSRPDSAVISVSESQREGIAGIGEDESKQILFGDFHIHTTFSPDAMAISLPIVQGEGAHPPADACDYARYCSALDFWSITDHAEGSTPDFWQETKETIRQCNAVTDPENPDTVAFLGYEWTQVDSFNQKNHYGHKNVIYRDIEEDKVPARAIFADMPLLRLVQENSGFLERFQISVGAGLMGEAYRDFNRYNYELNDAPLCEAGVHTKELPANCREGAATPADLFRKLDEGGYESIVIPHGNTWGLYTPPLSSWDKQLEGDMQNEKYQYMIEVFSGHGNSEEYRPYRFFDIDENGNRTCPEETPSNLPLCRQAGRIIKANCLAEGIKEEECERRKLLAQQHVVDGDYQEGTVAGADMDDWLDAGQCRDCWGPAYGYRPASSAQYALAIGNFDENPEKPRRFRFAFMASSDNHTARPGVGYKEIDRRENTEAVGQETDFIDKLVHLNTQPATSTELLNVDENGAPDPAYTFAHVERQASFFMTGGLVAVHAKDKKRENIWAGLESKEIYGTSGDRILLWFDLLNPDNSGNKAPMGSEVAMSETPRFQVKAVGAFKQKPGCPEYATSALSEERIHHLCRGECFNPSDERKIIDRIEVIRIKPQMYKNENVDNLIEDVWLTHQCEPDVNGCTFEFEDPEFLENDRETVYYVRALQQATDTVNIDPLRTKFDENGKAVSVDPCYGDSFKTPYEDDCLAPSEERAWSSPIFLDVKG